MKNEKWDDVHGNTTPDDRMVAFLESPTDSYAILQLREDVDDNIPLMFANYSYLQKKEMEPEIDRYEVVYHGSISMSEDVNRIFMDEYYEHLRADNIEAFSKERNDEYVGRAEEYKAAKSALLEGLGLEHLFDHSHELTPKEKEIWMLFDRVDVAELLARDAFAKGAYMLGAEDREIMLK